MPPNTKQRRSSPGVFRWWMVPLCVLACWLAWWSTAFWLSPKPAWSITLPNNRHYIPIKESPDQQLLLCTEMVIAPNSRRGETLGMVLLDPATGKVLHSIPVEAGEVFSGIGSSELSQFLSDTLAWLRVYRQSNGICTYRLHRWHFRENRISTTEQTWSGFHAHAHWPDKSNIVVFQYFVPLSIYQLGYFDNPYFKIGLRMFECVGHFSQFSWYESWELPTGTATEPRFLARWVSPYFGWGHNLTNDGQWAIYCEPIGNDHLASQRAKTSGKESFSGKELFDMYRTHNKQMLIYNTRTGKMQYRYSDQAAYHSVSQSRQNYLVMHTYYPGPDSKTTLAELNEATVNDNKYTRLFQQADELFRLDEQGITKLQRSPALIQAQLGNRLYFSGQRLQVFEEYSSKLAELAIDGNELNIKQVWSVSNARYTYRPSYLLPLGNQAIVNNLYTPMPETLAHWLANSPKLLKRAEKIWQLLHPPVEFTVVDSTDNKSREQAFTHVLYNNLQDASQLYCLEVRSHETESRSTLHAYALPMKLYSPWWSRVAGLLPLLLLLAYCLSANHPRRLAGG